MGTIVGAGKVGVDMIIEGVILGVDVGIGVTGEGITCVGEGEKYEEGAGVAVVEIGVCEGFGKLECSGVVVGLRE